MAPVAALRNSGSGHYVRITGARSLMRFDAIWHDARLATLALDRPGLGVVERGAIAARDGRIAFAGAEADLPTGWDAV